MRLRDGAMFCTHPLFRAEISDPESPLCEGSEFEPRFYFDDKPPGDKP
jgi:hypothetical protein